MNALAALKEEVSKKRKELGKESGERSGEGRPAKRWRSQADIEAEREQAYRAQEQKDAQLRMLERGKKQEQPYSKHQQDPVDGRDKGKESLLTNPENTSMPSKHQGLAEAGQNRNAQDDISAKEEIEKKTDSSIAKGTGSRVSKGEDEETKRTDDTTLHGSNIESPGKAENDAGGNADGGREEDAANSKEDYVYLEIRKYMRLWSSEIEALSKDEEKSNKGRSLTSSFQQTKDWLKPLNKLLKKKKVPRNILNGLKNIFEAAAEREYVRAYSLYLEQLAIGNAPWPMGATMVGIHARAAREKIGEDKIAHVMNDERTRKYIQAIKRLLTVAQRHFPTSPSKMIL